MSREDKPSHFCPDYCQFVIHRNFICRQRTECWHLKDRKVKAEVVELTISGQTRRVTIVGENNVFKPLWYLEDGSMLPKNYEIFSKPRKEKTQKEKYDEMKARTRNH
jgi:hypothetical protein